MRTNVFSKTSGKQADGSGRTSTASGFPSQMGYPTGDRPVQLKMTPQAFAFLTKYGLNVDNVEAFFAQVQKLDAKQTEEVASLLFDNRAALVRTTPEFDTLREIVDRRRLMLAMGDDYEAYSGAALADAKEDPVKNYVAKPKPPVASGSDAVPVDAQPETDEEEAEFMHYSALEQNQRQTKEKIAAAYLAKEVATWDPSKPFPDSKQLRKWASIRLHAGFGSHRFHPAIDPFIQYRWGGPEVAALALWLFEQSQKQAVVHASIGQFCDMALEELSPAQFQQAATDLAGSMGVDAMAKFLGASKNWASRMAKHKTSFPLHVFFFPGYSSGKWQSMFQAAQKLYGSQGIELNIAKTTVVTKEKAKEMGYEDANPFFMSYSARFKYSKNIKVSAKDLWSTLQPDAKTLGIYVFGEFQDTTAPHTTVGTTFSTGTPMKDCIIIGDGGGTTIMTLAHELGHLMGGKGGEHVDEKDNIMHPVVTDQRTRVHLYQLAFMKAHEASSAL